MVTHGVIEAMGNCGRLARGQGSLVRCCVPVQLRGAGKQCVVPRGHEPAAGSTPMDVVAAEPAVNGHIGCSGMWGGRV